ncbi:hypothetical protein HY837_02875 [archaeon]|nr:hypothetical protein [archaeon]
MASKNEETICCLKINKTNVGILIKKEELEQTGWLSQTNLIVGISGADSSKKVIVIEPSYNLDSVFLSNIPSQNLKRRDSTKYVSVPEKIKDKLTPGKKYPFKVKSNRIEIEFEEI